jgi:hypothetical protein
VLLEQTAGKAKDKKGSAQESGNQRLEIGFKKAKRGRRILAATTKRQGAAGKHTLNLLIII